MNKLHPSLTAILLLLGAVYAFAQEKQQLVTPDQIQTKMDEDAKQLKDDASIAFIDPSLSSPTRLPKLQAILAATRTDTRAELEVGFKSPPVSSSELHTGLKISGPIAKDASEAKLATLEGLNDQAKLTLSFRLLAPRPEARFFNQHKFIDALEKIWRIEHPGQTTPDSIIMTDLTERGQAQVLDGIGLGKGIFLVGVEGTYAAPRTFKFAIPETLAKGEEEHDGYTVAANVGWLPLSYKAPYFIGATYRREEGYQEQGKREICTPFGVGSALGCSEVVLGAPAKQIKDLGQLETRVYFRGGELAVNPRFTYDFANDISGLELPLYFLKDQKGTLNGGLAVGWRSDTDEYTFSAFVGTMMNPFSN